MIALTEFEARLKDLSSVETDKLFLELSEAGQKKWTDSYSKQITLRLRGIRAESAMLDLTHIAFHLRLLSEGRLWHRGPHKKLPGKPDGCYENCFVMVNDTSTIYVGYALNQGRKEWYESNGNGMEQLTGEVDPLYVWIPHAWLVTKDKRVLETTSNPFLAYFGVPTDPYEMWYLITSRLPLGSPLINDQDQAELAELLDKRVKYDFRMPNR